MRDLNATLTATWVGQSVKTENCIASKLSSQADTKNSIAEFKMKRNEGMGIDTDYVCPRLVVIDLKYVRIREFSDCRPFPLVNVTHEN
ncbi:hypothetical protein [Klebsiella variicola]|uniref:hypothetical protein n=1 Tax=Klebsiella variicola TaxID=244366 RepID=UPI003C6D5AA1